MLVETMTQEDFETQLTWGEKKELSGKLQGLKEVLLRLVRRKFGPPSPEVQTQIDRLQTPDEILPLFDSILTAESIEDLGLGA